MKSKKNHKTYRIEATSTDNLYEPVFSIRPIAHEFASVDEEIEYFAKLTVDALWHKIEPLLYQKKTLDSDINNISQNLPPYQSVSFIYDRTMLKQIAQNNNLRKLRKEKGFTQKQLASLLKLQCEDRLSHWEHGTSVPSLDNLLKLCEILKCTVEAIYN